MTAARLSRPMEAAGQWVRRLLVWWLNELSALVPPGVATGAVAGLLGRAWHPDRTATELEVGAGDVSLLVWRRGAAHPARVPLAGLEEDVRRQRVATALRQARSDPATTVRLDPSLLLNASVTLPAGAEANLRDILRLQIDQLVPLTAAEVCFEYWIAPYLPADRVITVHLVIATRASIDRALSLARAVGLDPRQVVAAPTPRAGAEGAGRQLVLLRVGQSWSEPGSRRRVLRLLEATALALIVLTYAAWVYRLDGARDDMAREVAALGRSAIETRAVAQRVSHLREELTALRRRVEEPGPLLILNEVSALLPDHVWITRLAQREAEVEISGIAPRATDLIALIEASSLFEKPHFRAPTTLSPDGRGERFEIGFSVRRPPS